MRKRTHSDPPDFTLIVPLPVEERRVIFSITEDETDRVYVAELHAAYKQFEDKFGSAPYWIRMPQDFLKAMVMQVAHRRVGGTGLHDHLTRWGTTEYKFGHALLATLVDDKNYIELTRCSIDS